MNYSKIYTEKNNNGQGFAVGEESDAINKVEGLGELIHDADVAVYKDGEKLTIVGDSNGPWAVEA